MMRRVITSLVLFMLVLSPAVIAAEEGQGEDEEEVAGG